MKKIVKVLSVLVVPIMIVGAFLSGCKKGKPVEVDNGDIMQDVNVAPTQTPAYEQYSKQALADYKAVEAKYLNEDGEIDWDNPAAELTKAANTAAAKLFAYACYNERTLDQYVYFSNQEGDTDLGGSGSARATRQEYYLRINESETTCGYRFHQTIKKVDESSGIVGGFKRYFENARIRITDQTNLLYRLEGEKDNLGGIKEVWYGEENKNLELNVLTTNWVTGDDWGKPDVEMKKSEFIPPEEIENDIVNCAGEDNITIRCNVNILAENAVKQATITETDDGSILLVMTLDTDVLNNDEASLKMLRNANSDDCKWEKGTDEEDTGFTIVCWLWGNGLFRFYNVRERWSGKVEIFSGTVESQTAYYYSYSDRDCDMTENLAMLENAKKLKEN